MLLSVWEFWSALRAMTATPVLVLHGLLATAVTGHVLLTKRDIGASVGWIGLAWLSPFLGGGLYALLGINRVQRRGARLRRRVAAPTAGEPRVVEAGDGALERAAHQISRRAALVGNEVRPLHDGDTAYPEMVASIDDARRSVALCSYIFRDDAAGAPIVDALIRAHRRGVAVRVLIDGVGGGYIVSPAFRRLREAGAPAARFLHSLRPWRMPFMNLRTHKKLLVLDGARAFTGGLNIGIENVAALRPPHPVRDLHFAVAGPVVGQLMEDFARDWLFTTDEALDGPAWFPDVTEAGPCVARVVTSGPDRELERIESLALIAVSCAGRSVRIMTPYFLPDERIVTALSLAALRGIAVDVVVPARSNHLFLDAALRANAGPLLHAGVRIWRNPPPFEHSKIMVIDERWVLIGSANWDMRSFRLNFELDLEITGGDLARALAAHVDARRGDRLTAAELARRHVPGRLRDAAARLLLPYL